VNSLFCRHNRFTADCPICSKGTVLDPNRTSTRPRPARPSSGGTRKRPAPGSAASASRVVAGPYASAGPYQDEAGDSYDVRLERVPGGVRLAEWAGGQIRRRAPVIEAGGLAALLTQAREREVLRPADAEALFNAACTEPVAGGAGAEPAGGAGAASGYGASRGRAGEMQEELRVERLEDERLRVGRWIMRPRAGWELQEAPVMLPVARYAEAIRAAASAGLLVS
jgi:hypothetical protein